MAKSTNKLIQLGIIGAGLLYASTAAENGQLPEFLQNFAHNLNKAKYPAAGTPAGGGGTGGGGTGGGGDTCDYTQIAGVRFVAQDAVGWYTYYNGSVYRANSQSEAEQKYNALVAASCR